MNLVDVRTTVIGRKSSKLSQTFAMTCRISYMVNYILLNVQQ